MLLYMNSRVFLREYLDYEEDWKILDTYYILASMRITRKKEDRKNQLIQVANSILFPSARVAVAETKKERKRLYFEQLRKNAMPYLATIIKGSIEKDYRFVFLNSRREEKNHNNMEFLAEFVMEEFQYPMYNYHNLVCEDEHEVDIDTTWVLEKCNQIIKKAKMDQKAKENPAKKKAKDLADAQFLSKKKLRKKLDKMGVCSSDENTREELLDLYLSLL